MEMAVRVRDFSDTHPSADPSFVSVLGRLKESIDRMIALGGQQVGGFLSRHSSTVRRRDVRRRLREKLLRHLVTIAEDAAVEKPELREKFHVPGHSLSTARFQTFARKMLEQGQAEKELLVKHGLTTTLLDDLAAAVAEFDASVEETNGGLQDHVLAGAELRKVSDEVLQLVSMMDGINRYRFEKEPQLQAAWETAKHVRTGPQAEKVENPGAPTGPVQAGPEEVKPAA
jgi:hypothetical protein